jgi:peptide-methionine (S)-S-oxide reductase
MIEGAETAILSGGCFWNMQHTLRRVPSVLSTRVGYIGGSLPHPTYDDHGTHAEAIRIVFDPALLSYRHILEFFFQIHDPTIERANDGGTDARYRSAIFYLSQAQRRIAQAAILSLDASGVLPGRVVTSLEPAGVFWEAEPVHQDYFERHPEQLACGHIRPGRKVLSDVRA